MIRIVLADDHAMLRQGLASLLNEQADIRVVAEAGSADELLSVLATARADVLVTDVAMPGPGLLPLLATLRHEHPALRTIVLSMYSEEQYAARALKGGAVGYLSKDRSPELLVEAVRKVMTGRLYVTPSLAESLAAGLAQPDPLSHQSLSDREFAVLKAIGAGRSMKEVAGALGISPKTVSTYRMRILEKLGAKSNAELVRYAVANGLVDG